MKVDYLSEFSFRLSDYAERTLCTDASSGNPKMAAKRKGGLKLNAICAKLSRQVVVDHKAAKPGHPDKAHLGREITGGSPVAKDAAPPGAKGSGPDFPDAVNRVQKIEEDKRREVIEKWVNGEYSEDSLLGRLEAKEAKGSSEGPPRASTWCSPRVAVMRRTTTGTKASP
ncbi:hypothetical protein JRQ81_009703 [Phrynocephalus forsythii]|uniref:Uncharacterized protein n=1 Tax=Phrynocephalus forsythii TaxID=171643 RepID=A0A9Q0X926_9SAUR|nr:hypothetical protein JRQ81_009703 [Phrynocephalus forsythii]